MSFVQTPAARPYSLSFAPLGDLLEARVRLGHEDRAEDLLADDHRVVVGRGEQGRLDEVAARVGLGGRSAAGDQLGLALAGLDVSADALVLLGADERGRRRCWGPGRGRGWSSSPARRAR